MFQTHLPSGRRRLLLFIFILFTIAVFGTRYLLLLFGWGEKQTDSTPKNQSEQTVSVVEQQQESNSITFTDEQLQQAKMIAEKFIKLYTQRDLSQSEAWYQSLESLLSPGYGEELRLEAEKMRPTQIVMKTAFQTIRRSICQPDGGNVACHLEVSIKEIDAREQVTLVDKNYEVILSLQNGNWMVEGLNLYGSLD